MLNVVSFYNNLVLQHGKIYAEAYFDIWFRFWCGCGDDMHNFSSFKSYLLNFKF